MIFLSAFARPIQKRIISSVQIEGDSLESRGVDTLERRPESLEGLFLRLPVGQAFDLGGHPLGFGFSKGVVLQTLRVAQPKCLALNRVAYALRFCFSQRVGHSSLRRVLPKPFTTPPGMCPV